MKHLKSYSLTIEDVHTQLKKYVIWRSHTYSKIYHILEIIEENKEQTYAIFRYCYDLDNKLKKDNLGKICSFHPTELLPENILDQSDNLKYLKDRISIIATTSKYNL